MYKCPWIDADGNACTGVHVITCYDHGRKYTSNIVCKNDGKYWDTDAPLGPWTVTWDIPNPWDDDLTRLKRTVIATWQPVEMWQGQLEPLRAKQYKKKNLLGETWL